MVPLSTVAKLNHQDRVALILTRHVPRHACRLLFILALATVLLLFPLPAAYRAPWLSKLLDILHLPLFLVLTLGIHGGLWRRAITWRARFPLSGCFSTTENRELAISVAVAVLLAALTEAGQMLTSRSASMGDFFRNDLGISLAVLWIVVSRQPRRYSTYVWAACAVLVLLAWPVCDAGPILYGAYSNWRAFPVVWNASAPSTVRGWHFDSADMEQVSENGLDEKGRVLFRPGTGGTSTMILFPIAKDWSRYQRMECELSFDGDPLFVRISIRDGRRIMPPQRRFEYRKCLTAGQHRVSIDLMEVARGGPNATVDLTRVQSVHLGVERITETRRVLLQRVWLE